MDNVKCKYKPNVREAQDGSLILVLKNTYSDDKKEIALNSTYKPLDEAFRFTNRYEDSNDKSVFVILGLGNGYIVRSLISKVQGGTFLIYEPEQEVYNFVKDHFDINDIEDDARVNIYTGRDGLLNLASYLSEKVDYIRLAVTKQIFLPKYKDIYQEECEAIDKVYKDWEQYIRNGAYTIKIMSERYMKNALNNIRYIFGATDIHELKKVIPTDIPAVIVSAGPSLSKNAHLLREIYDKAFILSLDSSLKYLISQDIKPHMSIMVDPKKYPHMMDNPSISQYPMAIHTGANYDVLKLHEDMRLVLSSNFNPYYDKLYETKGYKLPELETGGTVAHNALAFLTRLGFKKIILIGQDLALTGDKIYAGDDTVINEENTYGGARLVDAIGGGMVRTSADFYSYLKWFEIVIGNSKDIEVIDATEGGALIKGTKIMTFREAIDNYCHEKRDIKSAVDSALSVFDEKDKPYIDSMLEGSKTLLVEMSNKFMNISKLCEEASNMFLNNHINEKRLDYINKQIEITSNYISTNKEARMVEQLNNQVAVDAALNLYVNRSDIDAEAVRLYTMARFLYKSMSENALVLRDVFKEVNLESE